MEEVSWEPNAAMLAAWTIQGWLRAAGPVYTRTYATKVCREIVATLKAVGLGQVKAEWPDGSLQRVAHISNMVATWKAAHDKWQDRISVPWLHG